MESIFFNIFFARRSSFYVWWKRIFYWMLEATHTKISVNSTIQFLESCYGKSLKSFVPPNTKWRLCIIFVKLNGNHLLMANTFKLHEYQTFGLMEMHNMGKIWFANNKFSLWKSSFTINKSSKMLLFAFCLFHFLKFQITLFDNGFREFLWSFTTSKIFLIYTFLTLINI